MKKPKPIIEKVTARVAALYSFKDIGIEEIKAGVRDVTAAIDWDEDFYLKVYQGYLKLISKPHWT